MSSPLPPLHFMQCHRIIREAVGEVGTPEKPKIKRVPNPLLSEECDTDLFYDCAQFSLLRMLQHSASERRALMSPQELQMLAWVNAVCVHYASRRVAIECSPPDSAGGDGGDRKVAVAKSKAIRTFMLREDGEGVLRMEPVDVDNDTDLLDTFQRNVLRLVSVGGASTGTRALNRTSQIEALTHQHAKTLLEPRFPFYFLIDHFVRQVNLFLRHPQGAGETPRRIRKQIELFISIIVQMIYWTHRRFGEFSSQFSQSRQARSARARALEENVIPTLRAAVTEVLDAKQGPMLLRWFRRMKAEEDQVCVRVMAKAFALASDPEGRSDDKADLKSSDGNGGGQSNAGGASGGDMSNGGGDPADAGKDESPQCDDKKTGANGRLDKDGAANLAAEAIRKCDIYIARSKAHERDGDRDAAYNDLTKAIQCAQGAARLDIRPAIRIDLQKRVAHYVNKAYALRGEHTKRILSIRDPAGNPTAKGMSTPATPPARTMLSSESSPAATPGSVTPQTPTPSSSAPGTHVRLRSVADVDGAARRSRSSSRSSAAAAPAPPAPTTAAPPPPEKRLSFAEAVALFSERLADAIASVSAFFKSETVTGKIEQLCLACRRIPEALGGSITADDLISVLSLCIVLVKPKTLLGDAAFLNSIATAIAPEASLDHRGYCITSFVGAAEYLQAVQVRQLLGLVHGTSALLKRARKKRKKRRARKNV